MVTKPLFLAEHMDARGINDEDLADKLDVARETVTRYRNEQRRLDPYKMDQIAKAISKLRPDMPMKARDLWQDPTRPSVDAVLEGASPEAAEQMAKLASLLVRDMKR